MRHFKTYTRISRKQPVHLKPSHSVVCLYVCVLRMCRNRARKFYILSFRSPKFAVTSCMHSLCRAARVIRFPRAFFLFVFLPVVLRCFACAMSVYEFCIPWRRRRRCHCTWWFSFFYVVNKSKFTFLIRIVMLLLLSWRCVPCNEDIGLRNWV